MFVLPGSLAAGTRGACSLATVAMAPAAEPSQSAARSGPSAGLSGGPILAKGPQRSISVSAVSAAHRQGDGALGADLGGGPPALHRLTGEQQIPPTRVRPD